ncbi:MAG: hypothetical protein JO171_03570 [Paludibacterium sp.]|uniref:hypothetical protein n=1 Tax=Paludibacterium sp. TaxID=1917523 RepID=UPI0025F3B8FD|nr:hypothetical protein [Paludibacterium sp.]MBV8046204.1 hypothetical protein [Paludibacterium sp.]MBV8646914.1 hypothetical protein [Paludibacterium sp.]
MKYIIPAIFIVWLLDANAHTVTFQGTHLVNMCSIRLILSDEPGNTAQIDAGAHVHITQITYTIANDDDDDMTFYRPTSSHTFNQTHICRLTKCGAQSVTLECHDNNKPGYVTTVVFRD